MAAWSAVGQGDPERLDGDAVTNICSGSDIFHFFMEMKDRMLKFCYHDTEVDLCSNADPGISLSTDVPGIFADNSKCLRKRRGGLSRADHRICGHHGRRNAAYGR